MFDFSSRFENDRNVLRLYSTLHKIMYKHFNVLGKTSEYKMFQDAILDSAKRRSSVDQRVLGMLRTALENFKEPPEVKNFFANLNEISF